MQLGTWVYCFDLAEKKELWEKNLLGDNVAVEPRNRGIRRSRWDRTATSPSGTPTATSSRSARPTVLQPGYAALLTRDGLEVVEPLTRRVLWTRRDITERTQLYGDARYIVLVETDANTQAGRGASCSARSTAWRSRAARDSGRVLADARVVPDLRPHTRS